MTEQAGQPAGATTPSQVTPELLDDIVRRLVPVVLPERIYLFGSRATGRSRPDSDIDLLIVVPDDSPNRYDLGHRAYAVLRDIAVPVELHFCRTSHFERFGRVNGSLPREARERGRLLYAA